MNGRITCLMFCELLLFILILSFGVVCGENSTSSSVRRAINVKSYVKNHSLPSRTHTESNEAEQLDVRLTYVSNKNSNYTGESDKDDENEDMFITDKKALRMGEVMKPKNDQPSFRIINGKPARLGDLPYQIGFRVLRMRSNFYKIFCGGTLVGVNKIVSAAHCFYKRDVVPKRKLLDNGVFAVAGAIANEAVYQRDGEGSEQWRKISKVACPNKYQFPHFDISCVITVSDYIINEYVTPIPYITNYVDFGDQDCICSGYGRVAGPKHARSPVLLVGKVKVLKTATCSELHERPMERYICSTNVISDAAKGDSGGPLVCLHSSDIYSTPSLVLVGVVSGKADTNIGVSSFFTRVSSYSKFLDKLTDESWGKETMYRSSSISDSCQPGSSVSFVHGFVFTVLLLI